MDKKKIRFKELITEVYRKEGCKADALLGLKSEIAEARSYHFSFGRIAELLNQVDIPVSTDAVRRFCQKHLKEKPRKRSPNRKNINDSIKPSLTGAKEKIKQDLSKYSTETTDSTLQQEQQMRSTVSSRVGPRPGFRIARDNL